MSDRVNTATAAVRHEPRSRQSNLVIILLCVSTVTAYIGSLRNDFSNYDDDVYVTDNTVVRRGLTEQGAWWAFTTGRGSNWHPLTWLSHMADVEIGGLNPAFHHGSSLLLHSFNVVLLFIVLRRMTGSVWRSGFTAAVFALHPLHVESVAWIAERKDVLSTAFGLLALLAYVGYIRQPSMRGMAAVAILMLLGLLAKPTLVIFPFTLLLLDYWPLRRYVRSVPGTDLKNRHRSLLRRVKEKIPLFALTLAFAVITIIIQRRGGAMRFAESIPFAERFANAVISYTRYIGKTLWPSDLAVFYPYPENGLPFWQIAGAFLIIAGITIAVVFARRVRPFLLTGWLWFLGTLVPVIGFVQVGWQSMADRYMYIPQIGLAVMVAWGFPSFMRKQNSKLLLAGVACLVLVFLMAGTMQQVKYWSDSETLFEHALAATSGNWIACANLGTVAQLKGDTSRALSLYREARRIMPDDIEINKNLGMLFTGLGLYDSAARYYETSLRIDPHFPMLQYNYAYLMMKTGRTEMAVEHFIRAVDDNPYDIRPRYLLGKLLGVLGRYDAAIGQFRAVLRIDSTFKPASEAIIGLYHQAGRQIVSGKEGKE